MTKRVVLLALTALLLTGCGTIGELGGKAAEPAVLKALEAFNPIWLKSFLLQLNIGQDFPWLYTLLLFPIAASVIVALHYAARDDSRALIYDGIALGLALVALLPWFMNLFGSKILAVLVPVLYLPRIFDGMNWIPDILSNLTKLDIPGVAGVSSAVSTVIVLPFYHQVAGIIAVLVYIACLVVTPIIRNTRVLWLSAVQIAGWLLFPVLWAILTVALVTIERFRIPLFQLETLNLGVEIPLPDTVLNTLFVFVTWGLMVGCYLILPMIGMIFLPAYDFRGEKLPRPDVSGRLKAATSGFKSQLGGVAGLAGKVPDRRGVAPAGSTSQGDGPAGTPPSQTPGAPSGPFDPRSPIPSSDDGGRKGVLADKDQKADNGLKRKGEKPQLGTLEAQNLALSAQILGSEGSQQPGMPKPESRRTGPFDKAKQAVGKQAKMLGGAARVGAALATVAGRPELALTLAATSQVYGEISRRFLPEGKGAPNGLRRSVARPRTSFESKRFLAEAT